MQETPTVAIILELFKCSNQFESNIGWCSKAHLLTGTFTRRHCWSYSWIFPYQCQLQSFDSSSTELLWSTLQASQCSYAGYFRLIPKPTDTLTSLQQSHDLVDSHIRSLSSLEKDRESYKLIF